MNGIIVVNKPLGLTSHDVVNKIRRIFNTKKVGHNGTLDPNASGVLVLCINDATKLVQFLEADSKVYIAEVLIGKSTDTFDATGKVLEEQEITNLSNDDIDNVLEKFKGKIKQVPPIYSAIKKNGKKLYEYARSGQEVELPERDIEIFNIKRISDVVDHNGYFTFTIETHVSKGTYIRSLCVDISKALGYPGLMNNLKRIKSGRFSINDAYTLEDIEQGNYKLYTPLDTMKDYPTLNDKDSIYKALHGMKISPNFVFEKFNDKPNRIIIVKDDNLIGIYDLDLEKYCYRAVRVWN